MNGAGTTLKAQLIQLDDLTRSYHEHCAKLEGELKVLRLENDRLARKLKDSGDYVDKYGKLKQEYEEFQTSANEQINSLSLKYQITNAHLEDCKAKLSSQSNGEKEEGKVVKEKANVAKELTKSKTTKPKVKKPLVSSPVASHDDDEFKKLNVKLGTALRENIKLRERIQVVEKLKVELELENYTYRKEIKPLTADKYTDKEFDKSIDEKINKGVKKYKEKNAALEEASRELQKANKELQSQVSGYQLEISLLQDCQDSKHSAEERKKMVKKLEKEIAEIKLDKDAVVCENDDLRKKIGELKIKISKLQDQIRESLDTPSDDFMNNIFREMCVGIPALLSPEQDDYPENRTCFDEVENDYCSTPPRELDMPDMDQSSPALLSPIVSPKKVENDKITHSEKSTNISSRHCIKKHRTIPDILGTLRYLDKHRMFFTISNVPIKPVNKISRSSLTELHENVNLVKSQKIMQRNSKCQLSCHVKGCCDNSFFLLRSEDDESDLLGFYSVKDETKKKTVAIPASEQHKEQLSRVDLLTTRRDRRIKLRKSRLNMSAKMIICKLKENMLLKRKKQIRRRSCRRMVRTGDNNEEQSIATTNTEERYDDDATNDENVESEIGEQIVEAESILETQSVASEICDNDRDMPEVISSKVETSTVILDDNNKHSIKKSSLSMLRQRIRKCSATPLWTGCVKRDAEPTSEETTEYSPRPKVKRISHEVIDVRKTPRKDSCDKGNIVGCDLTTATRLDRLSITRRQSPRFLSSRQSPKLSQGSDVERGESVETESSKTQVQRITDEISEVRKNRKDSCDSAIVDFNLTTATRLDFLSTTNRQSPRLLHKQSLNLTQGSHDRGESVETESTMTQVRFEKVVKSPVVQEPKPFAQIKIQPLQVDLPQVIPVEWTKKNGYFKIPSTTLYENMKESLVKTPSILSSNKNKGTPYKISRTIPTPPDCLDQIEMPCDKESSTECENPTSAKPLENCSSPLSPPRVTPVTPLDVSVTLLEHKESPQSPPLLEKGTFQQLVVHNSQSTPLPETTSLSQPTVLQPVEYQLPDESETLHSKKSLVSSCTKTPEKTSTPEAVKTKKTAPKRKQQPCDVVSQIEQAEAQEIPPLLEKGTFDQPVVQSSQSTTLPKKKPLRQSRVLQPVEHKLPDESEALHRKKPLVSSCSKIIFSEKTSPPKAVKARKTDQKRKRQPYFDLVSQIEQAMSASSAKPVANLAPAKVRKCAVVAVPLEEEQCSFLVDSKIDEGPKRPLSKAEIELLFEKLMNYSSEEKALNEVVAQFARQNSEYVAKAVLGRIALDVHDKPDARYYPAPLMTQTQRVMLGFMLSLEKVGMETICFDFLKLADQKMLQSIELTQMLPIANFYLAVCKCKKDIHRMRRLCCEVAYYSGNLIVPLLFLVLGSWTEVLPHHDDIAKNPMAKVLVQVVYMKNCTDLPGYNLMPLRDLLIKFYGYPTERWDSDEVFLELYNDYLKKPDSTTDLPLIILCKNHSEEWVNKKIDEYFKPLVSKVPTENSKATVIILIGHLSSSFSNKDKIVGWMESLMEDTTSDLVQSSIDFCLDRFQNK